MFIYIMHEIVMTMFYCTFLVDNDILQTYDCWSIITLNHNSIFIVHHEPYLLKRACHITDITEVNRVFHPAILVQYLVDLLD